MNLSTGINLQKELNAIMRRVKKPKIHDKEECIFCCDDNMMMDMIIKIMRSMI